MSAIEMPVARSSNRAIRKFLANRAAVLGTFPGRFFCDCSHTCPGLRDTTRFRPALRLFANRLQPLTGSVQMSWGAIYLPEWHTVRVLH